MARKARWFGLLATYRELTPEERAALDRLLDDDPEAREAKRRFDEQDAALASLDVPAMSPAVTDRVMAATVARDGGAPLRRLRPLVAVALSLVFLVLVAGTGLASPDSLPGDALYPIKRAGEQVRMALILHEQARARYAEHLIGVRRQEVNALLELGRAGVSVEFEGPLEHTPAGEWLVAGVPVVLPEGAVEMHEVTAGSPVYVTGAIGQERVRVQTMRPVMSSATPRGPQDQSRGRTDEFTPPGQTDEFTPPGQIDKDTPPGQADKGTPPGRMDKDTPSDQIGNDTPPGQANKATPPGQADKDIPPGQADKDTPPGQADKDVPPGQADKHTPSGQADKATPPSQADKATPPGQADKATPPSQADKGTPPGQADKATPPGQADKGTPPGQAGSDTPPGQAGKGMSPGQIDKDRPPGQANKDTPPGQIKHRTPPGLDKGPQTPAAPES